MIYPGDEEYEWHEINVFIDTEDDSRCVANILGRDVTEAHMQQENKERELRASAACDQLLSGITKMLYSYNMTVNLNTSHPHHRHRSGSHHRPYQGHRPL